MMAARPKHVALSKDVLLHYQVVLVPCMLLSSDSTTAWLYPGRTDYAYSLIRPKQIK
jgi:hypothetical protein